MLVVGVVGRPELRRRRRVRRRRRRCSSAAVALARRAAGDDDRRQAIADPVTSVRAALERVARGDLDAEVAVDDGSEVGLLQAGFNRMAEGLRERERIRDLFGRQVGEDVARAALRGGARLGGEEREIGALFVDLVGLDLDGPGDAADRGRARCSTASSASSSRWSRPRAGS